MNLLTGKTPRRSIPVSFALVLCLGLLAWSSSVRADSEWTTYSPLVYATNSVAAEPSATASATATATSAPTKPAVAVYYVALTGNDSNPGTQSQPWRTIQKAANTMVAGDSTTVLAGNYSERVQVTRSGAPAAPITYRAEGTVTMKGFTVRADYITIGGFEISDTDDIWDDGAGIFVEGSYCVIEGNYVHFATRSGIWLSASPWDGSKTSYCIVKNNRLYRNGGWN